MLRLLLAVMAAALVQSPSLAMTPEEIIAALRKPENSTGNIADAVEEATGARGWMSADMKPVLDRKIVGRAWTALLRPVLKTALGVAPDATLGAWTALLRPVLKTDDRKYPNYALQILDEAPPGSVLVYVLEGAPEIAGMGNLMATTAKVRGLEATVIDGAVRDVAEIRRIGYPVFARRISPATSVGRLVGAAKQVPVRCGEVMVNPGDYIVGDTDGVVVVPQAAADRVVALLRQYDDKESKMIPIIQREKSMQKALEIYNRY
jgi:regulator of RNase E activity RraA